MSPMICMNEHKGVDTFERACIRWGWKATSCVLFLLDTCLWGQHRGLVRGVSGCVILLCP